MKSLFRSGFAWFVAALVLVTSAAHAGPTLLNARHWPTKPVWR